LVSVFFPNGENLRFLVDCGLYQEKDSDALNSKLNFDPSNINFALVTHNHCDHTGRIPMLVKEGFEGPIYSSNSNCKLMPPALYDSAKVLQSLAKNKNVKSVYTDLNVEYAIQHLKGCNWNETVQYNDNVRFVFFKNGHLLGASLILVQLSYPEYEDINILFTGDYNYKNTFFDVPSLPQWVLDLPLTVVIESTYGNRNSDDIEMCFNRNVIEAVNQNATIIAPVFSQGRAQEILYELKKMQQTSLLKSDVPIFLDGKLSHQYCRLYEKSSDITPDLQNFYPDNFTFVNKDWRETLIHSNETKIILTTSGMGSYGPAQMYLPEYIARKNTLIHFTGYCAEGTLGYSLKNAKAGDAVTIGGRLIKKSAVVEFTKEFSAHAKADELINFLQQFSSIKLLLVQHGEPDAKEQLAKSALEKCPNVKDVALLGNGYLFKADHYGFVKSISTKY
jgi:metallo-beta-lactamase family protein